MQHRTDIPSQIDKIPYDAPLSFPLPPKSWTDAMGGTPNNRTETLTEIDVPPVSLVGKWILITGSNTGIGREAALTFAKWGANLILACCEARPNDFHPLTTVEDCRVKAAQNGHQNSIEWWQYDATDLASVEALAKRWLATNRPLDILCNNTGVGSAPDMGQKVFKTKDGFEFIHQINFLSHVLLTLYLLPSLAKASAPRIVCTISCFHFLGQYDIANFNGDVGDTGIAGQQFYKNNKLYFQIWLCELQNRMLGHNKYRHITVNGFHPGYVASGIWHAQHRTFITIIIGYILVLLARLFGITTKQGSMGMVYLSTSPECGPDPKTQGGKDPRGKGGGRYFNRIWEQDAMPHCKDRDARLRVWRRVNEELQLQEKGLLDVLGLYSGDEK